MQQSHQSLSKMSLYVSMGLLGAVATFFDVGWFARLVYTKLTSVLGRKIDLKKGETGVIKSICWTSDVDYFFHMNNAKYLRELDFARFDFYFRTGLADFFESAPRINVVQHAAAIRYRRSIDFLSRFEVVTKLVYFDERSLYFEQRFVTTRDGFIRAVALCKNTAVEQCNLIHMMKDRFGLDQPVCPEEVGKFIETNEKSSLALKMEAAQK